MLEAQRQQELAAKVNALEWWHRIDLGGGLVTPGRANSPGKLARLQLPERLDGLRVLDIGAWDGFYSFEAERRGAEVVAMDLLAWQRGPRSGRPCFELARETLGSKVTDVTCDVMDLTPQVAGTFDLVLCLGVIYHLRDPLGALERIASVTRDRLILETHVDALGCRRPAMVFYPDAELNQDPSNWWGPNEAALSAMLLDVGFRGPRVVYRDSRVRRALRAVRFARRAPPWGTFQQGRVVVHASKLKGID